MLSRRLPALLVVLVMGVSLATGAAAPSAPAKPPGLVGDIRVLPDKAPDCSSLKSIAQSVTRQCQTNDQKAVAIYNFMLLSHYHRAYPNEPGGISALKGINTYGWSLCGGLHATQSALWRELGWDWRFVGWDGHTTVEAGYDGKWHYLDAFLKFYAWMPDPNSPGGRTIAGEDDLNANAQGLIVDAFTLDGGRSVVYPGNNRFELIGNKANWMAPAMLSCGDTIKDVVGGLKTHKQAGKPPGWNAINHATGNYSAEVDLAPGFSLTNTWEPVEGAWYWAGSKEAPRHTCGNKDLRNSPDAGLVLEPYFQHIRGYANGTLLFAPDFGNDALLKSFAAMENVKYDGGVLKPAQAGLPASVTVWLASPYNMTRGTGSADGAESFSISIDGGKTFKPADIKDFTAAVKGQVKALARIGFNQGLTALKLEVLVQNNPGSLPYLSPGKNTITVSAGEAGNLGDNRLIITYAYNPGYRGKSFEQLCNEGKEVAKQHNAVWADVPTVVQKVFTAKDLPATFDIDIATPKDKYPVYPRMLFLRREVVAAGSKPLPLPANARAPEPSPDAELKTLPNPFLMGSQTPPPRVVRAIKTSTIDLHAGPMVARSAPVPADMVLKWPKTAQEKVDALALPITGRLAPLPKLEQFAAARLVFPVASAHEQAPTKVGITQLRSPSPMASANYDFAAIGEVLATAIVPKLDKGETGWNPPRLFKVDVTRAIRGIITNDSQFTGFALRVVPDRGVDDGWTVRIQLPKQPRIILEIDTYVE